MKSVDAATVQHRVDRSSTEVLERRRSTLVVQRASQRQRRLVASVQQYELATAGAASRLVPAQKVKDAAGRRQRVRARPLAVESKPPRLQQLDAHRRRRAAGRPL